MLRNVLKINLLITESEELLRSCFTVFISVKKLVIMRMNGKKGSADYKTEKTALSTVCTAGAATILVPIGVG